jgi:hypothetical protein
VGQIRKLGQFGRINIGVMGCALHGVIVVQAKRNPAEAGFAGDQ